MIGAFYQPVSVIVDTNTSIPYPKEKSVLVWRKSSNTVQSLMLLLNGLKKAYDDLVSLKQDELEYCIQRCCQLKADVVARDETEKGDRALLNLGHTFGHAIEARMGYGMVTRRGCFGWYARGCGIISYSGDLSPQEVARLEKLLARANLPTISPDGMEPAEYLPYMWRDKSTGRSITPNFIEITW